MADLIDRQTAIETAIEAADKWDGGYSSEREGIIRKFFDKVPAAQPDHNADISKKVADEDCISRQAAIDAIMGQPPEPHYPSWYAAQIKKLPAVQPDHNADVSKKVDMMHEYICKIVKDCDGVNCYIKQGKIIRCKDCKHRHVENMIWTCPFGLPGGENFFCGYGTEPYKGK